ncbi:MAG: hypothetical protein QM632_07075 [Micrococcaceae bacterium]
MLSQTFQGSINVFCDSAYSSEKICDFESILVHDKPETALRGATTVLLRMPKALSRLEEYCQLITQYSHPTVKVYCAGKDKHMNKSFNAVLSRYFNDVQASLGWKNAELFLLPRLQLRQALVFQKRVSLKS